MNVHDHLFRLASLHHDALLALLHELEEAQTKHEQPLPPEALRLQGAIWPFLQAYGRRDHHGSVDEEIALPLKPWRPGDDEVAP